MFQIKSFVLTIVMLLTPASNAWSEVSEYTSFTAWQQAAGSYSTIDFTGLGQYVVVSTQYSHLGVLFTDGDNATDGPGFITFPQDGWGLHPGHNQHIMVELTSPAYVFAAHHPGVIRFQLFLNDQPVYTSSSMGSSGYNKFSGLVSDVAFNRIRIWDPEDHLVAVDNIYVYVPSPGAFGVFMLAAMFGGSRRRRS